MPDDVLDSFINQIASWARLAIDQGRSPFRKVETSLPLLTCQGELLAPLVFWINRDSFMAGGLVVFSEQGSQTVTERGVLMAEALGLQNFVEWAEQRINFWKLDGTRVSLETAFPLLENQSNPVATFKHLLDKTLDKLKYLSVLSSAPPERLAPSYLANLCRTAIHDTLPLLAAEKRVSQGTGGTPDESWALAKGYQTATRLLTLTTFDLLPSAVHPEGLEKAMRFALPEIPEILRNQLVFTEETLPLPNTAAVRFHHLLRRLQQLSMEQTTRRTSDCLNLLLAYDGAQLAGATAPQLEFEALCPPTLSVNLATQPDKVPETIEIAPAPLLAMKALIRHLEGWCHPELQSPELFTLQLPKRPASIFGVLFRQLRPSQLQRQQYEAALRISWPTRRFTLPPATPIWLLECLHLLGLCRPDGRLLLRTPADWLSESWGEPIWAIISQEFTLYQLTLNTASETDLSLVRRSQPEVETALQGVATSQWRWADLSQQSRQALLARLSFSSSWLSLLAAGKLRSYQDTAMPGRYPLALQYFFRQQPGRSLAELFGVNPEQEFAHLVAEIVRLGIPAPAEERLERLESLLLDDSSLGQASKGSFRESLSRLGAEFAHLPQLQQDESGRLAGTGRRYKRISRDMANVLRSEIFIDGIPDFPEHYLYDYFRPQLDKYSWQGELVYGQTFFDLIVLQDSTGQKIEVAGERTAAGLWLMAQCGRNEIEFPVAPDICDTILERYLEDLQRLRLSLVRKVRERLSHPRQAENLIRKIWGLQRLPPWESVEKVMALFPRRFDVE